MKIGFNKIAFFLTLLAFCVPAYAAGTIIATAILVGYSATTIAVVAFAINMVISAVITKAFFSPQQPSYNGIGSGETPNLGNRQQIAPATDNKLPIVYGTAWVGGVVIDLSITSDNQDMYFVLALSEVTGNGGDTFSFGDIYFGGKRVVFSGASSVGGLQDQSTGVTDTSVDGFMDIYLFSNGSYSGVNTGQSAIQIMQSPNLIYTWDSTKLMSNTAFAILHIKYNSNAGLTGLQQTKFQVINPRSYTGNVITDYLENTTYGASLTSAQIDQFSFNALTAYSNQLITFTNSSGGTSTQPRFRFNGVIDTKRTIMANLQDMMTCCDSLLTYNEITAEWGVIVQSPTYTVAMALNDSNITSAIQVTPLDSAGSYNVIECNYPDSQNQDSFNTVTFDLAEIDPTLLYPNEPVNKVSLNLPLVNNSVTAQCIANRILKSGREDLQVQLNINYSGIQLQAGDIVSVTNTNYGWSAKLFRINKVIESFGDDGTIIAKLTLTEFNPDIYDDVSITEFLPSPNTGLSDPNLFSTIPVPVISNEQSNATVPSFQVTVTTPTQGIVQYAEIYYSAYFNPTASQYIFAGTTEVQPSGTTYGNSVAINPVTLTNIPAGDWYFFTRMVNSLATSVYSAGSNVIKWRPQTFQFSSKYLVVAYADDINGTGFNLNPTNKFYYGLRNQATSTPSLTASDYKWYQASPSFGTTNYLLFTNRGNRLMSFATGTASPAAGSALFVPDDPTLFDPSIWSGLPIGTNAIDLDERTGQLIQTGTTTVGTGEIAVTNNPNGTIVASLQPFLNFGTGIYAKTSAVSNLTIDIYGRVVGFEQPDTFYYTTQVFTATAGSTVFSVTRGTGYITGQCLVFENGCLLNPSQYTDSASAVTFATGRTAGDIITVISFKSLSSVSLLTTGASGTGSTATLTFGLRPTAPYTVGQSITVSGVTPAGYNGTYTVTACTTSTVSYANATTGSQTVSGTIVATNLYYPSFTNNIVTLTNQASYTASGFTLVSGYELLFLNGVVLNQNDYNIAGSTISFLGGTSSGTLQVLQWSNNNLGVPNGNPVNVIANTVVGQTVYNFSFDPSAFNIYDNGVLLLQTVDFTTATGSYTLTNTPVYVDILLQQTFTINGVV